jgi:dephospho-CoA kinase
VYAAIADWFRAAPERTPLWPFRVADIPLLYETGGDQLVDRVIVVACAEASQLTRLLARGLSADDARLRIGAQMPVHEKLRRANFVIHTDGSTGETDDQVGVVCEQLRAEFS